MSWLTMLYDTYNNVSCEDGPLPIAHTTQNADVEILLDMEGNFLSCGVVEGHKQTLIPCTESSASRTTNSAPHPLHDKLQYVAGDYSAFGGKKGDEFYQDYMSELNKWCDSRFYNPKVCAVLKYLQKGCLIADLVRKGTLVENDGKLLDKWTGTKEDTPQIFKILIGKQSDAFVRFMVACSDSAAPLWKDSKLQQDYINYYNSLQDKKEMCYATGDFVPCSSNHPSKIRHTGDKAKLISANDDTGFTYRGRFKGAEESVQISYEVSQKAHNALKWLIQKQGKRFGDKGEKIFLLWGTKNEKMPGLTCDTAEEALQNYEEDEEEKQTTYTKEEIARRFNVAISGYKANINVGTRLALIGLDSATTGRLSVTYYREFIGKQGNDLYDNIKAWHEECAWLHRYKRHNKQTIVFVGSPGLEDIAAAAFGTEQTTGIKANGKLVGATVERLIPCIVDKAHVPVDVVNALVRKAQHPQNYSEDFNWQKVLSITCSILKRHRFEKFGEVWDMNVNHESQDAVYNCGRLLATADAIERFSLSLRGEKRQTNAIRYFTKFAADPCRTWGIINNKLKVHEGKLGARGKKLVDLKQEISSRISPETFIELKNLDGRMVLGFDSQKNEFYKDFWKKEAGGESNEYSEEQN